MGASQSCVEADSNATATKLPELTFVRHAQSCVNLAKETGKWWDRAMTRDPWITTNGRVSVESALASVLNTINPPNECSKPVTTTIIYCSELLRAIQTALQIRHELVFRLRSRKTLCDNDYMQQIKVIVAPYLAELPRHHRANRPMSQEDQIQRLTASDGSVVDYGKINAFRAEHPTCNTHESDLRKFVTFLRNYAPEDIATMNVIVVTHGNLMRQPLDRGGLGLTREQTQNNLVAVRATVLSDGKLNVIENSWTQGHTNTLKLEEKRQEYHSHCRGGGILQRDDTEQLGIVDFFAEGLRTK